jgi:hypothetical protein
MDNLGMKYTFFNDDRDQTNFEILRQCPKTTNNGSVSPRLPSDFEGFDGDNNILATHKLSHLEFKRPPTPAKYTAMNLDHSMLAPSLANKKQ